MTDNFIEFVLISFITELKHDILSSHLPNEVPYHRSILRNSEFVLLRLLKLGTINDIVYHSYRENLLLEILQLHHVLWVFTKELVFDFLYLLCSLIS